MPPTELPPKEPPPTDLPATDLPATGLPQIDTDLQTAIEAAAFRALRAHLLEARPEVQNIDLMNLAGFCRNCLSRWMQEAASERGLTLSKEQGRTLFYGMPYDAWRDLHQSEADAAKKAAFELAFKKNVGKSG